MIPTVACVLKSGGIYNAEWAQKLQHNVAQHMSRKYQFVCLTDMGVPGVTTQALRHSLKGWWSKIELFAKNQFPGPVLYLDLDCLIVDQLDDLFVRRGFSMVDDFISASKNSSVMSWTGNMSSIYDDFMQDPAGHIHHYDRMRPGGRVGDQAFIEDHMLANSLPAERVVSYKITSKVQPKPGASVIAFHGKPKQNIAKGWPREMWSDL